MPNVVSFEESRERARKELTDEINSLEYVYIPGQPLDAKWRTDFVEYFKKIKVLFEITEEDLEKIIRIQCQTGVNTARSWIQNGSCPAPRMPAILKVVVEQAESAYKTKRDSRK